MGRVYVAETTFDHTGPAILCYLECLAPMTYIHEVRLDQWTDAGDSEAEMMRLIIGRSLNPPNNAAIAGATAMDFSGDPVPTNLWYPYELNADNNPSFFKAAWNIQAGFIYLPLVEDRIKIPSTLGWFFAVTMPQLTPSDPFSAACNVVWEEVG